MRNIFIIVCLFFLISCAHEPKKEKKVELTILQKDSIEKDKEEKQAKAKLLSYKRNKPWGLDKAWDTHGFGIFGNDYDGFKAVFIDTVSDEKLRLIRETNWVIYRGYYSHWQAIVYKRFFNSTSKPNLHIDSLIKQLDIETNLIKIRDLKLKMIDSILTDSDIKEGRISKELFENFRLFRLVFHHVNNDYFPLQYRNKRTCELVWNVTKPILFRNLQRHNYDKINAKFYIDNLLLSYSILDSMNANTFFQEAIENNKSSLDYSKFMTDKFNNKFVNTGRLLENPESMDYSIQQWKNWFFSFWYRRYIEGTSEITYKALEDIKNNYK